MKTLKLLFVSTFCSVFFANQSISQNNGYDSTINTVLISQSDRNAPTGNSLFLYKKDMLTETIRIVEDQRIKVWLLNGRIVSGKFCIVTNEQIEIDGDTIPLKNISCIRGSVKEKKNAGAILMFVGTGMTIAGVICLLDGGSTYSFLYEYWQRFLPPGTILLGAGGSIYFIERRFSTQEGWEISIQ